MPLWIFYSVIVILLWGVVGLFQKLGTNRISARSLLVWLTVGYFVLVPMLLRGADLRALKWQTIFVGVLGGFTNGLGAWYLLASLESGANASIAVPLTALNPLVTILLALCFLHERLTPLQWFGVAAALAAGVMISYEKESS
jgi:transporter family protein